MRLEQKLSEYVQYEQAKVDRLAGKINFVQKNTSKTAIFVCTNLSYLTLEGPGRQTFNTRSTAGVALKTLGYNASNQLCGRSVAPKLSAHEPATFFLVCVHVNLRKSDFLGKTLRTRKFSTGKFFWAGTRTHDSENIVGLGDQASVKKEVSKKLILSYFWSDRFETNRIWAPILGLQTHFSPIYVSRR